MQENEGKIIVGILGQWASGKSTAAKILVAYLGGEDGVEFISDRELLARQAVNHILESGEAEVNSRIEQDGARRLESELAAVYLNPGEDLQTVDFNNLHFDLYEDVYDNVAPGSYSWFDLVRLELGYRICESSQCGKPVVIEAGFGTNTDPRGENPFSQTIADLFDRLDETGVEPDLVKWIIIEAGYEKRSVRNRKRPDTVPAVEFDRFAADGGDLDPGQQKELEARGTIIKRVPNNHDDVERFKADIITAFEEMFAGVLPMGTDNGSREQT